MLAVERGHADCVRFLLQAGANMETKNNVRGMFVLDLRNAI